MVRFGSLCRPVHLLHEQYRSKLRGTEKRLRDAEHRAFDLARQLGEAAEAEAATRKVRRGGTCVIWRTGDVFVDQMCSRPSEVPA